MWAKLACVLMVILATAWTVAYRLIWGSQHFDLVLCYYLAITGMLVYSLLAAAKGRTFDHLPPASGRVVAIVPAYNEEPELLRDTVMALVNQSRPPDEIHVIDDGSKIPVESFDHPLVTWYRQDNGGKREAQATVLRQIDPESFDFLLTVDSDSILERDALRNTLKALSDERVQAATGLTLVLNRTKNLLTRVIDLEIVTWCLVTRMARSLVGAVAPTSGILAVYRKGLVYDNLDDYVTSGTAGDDRRLTHYALERGQVVAVNNALVYSSMPEDVGELWKQRTRWFKSYWRYVFWEIENFRIVPFLFRLYGLVVTLMAPVFYIWVLIVLPLPAAVVLLMGLGYWAILTYSLTGMYAVLRPDMSLKSRVFSWLVLTPLVTLMNLVIIKPAMYWALTKMRDTSWQTRTASTEAPRLLVEQTKYLPAVGELS